MSQFSTIGEFNTYLSENQRRIKLDEYFKEIHAKFYPELDISFMDYFLELINKKDEILSVRKNILKETYEYKLLNDKIKAMKMAVDKKVNNEKFTDFTRHIEQVSNILYSYSILESKQDKLQVEVFEIKKRLEKIFNIISSKK